MMMNAQRTTREYDIAGAEDWFARLSSDDVTAADRVAFENWRGASPENEAAYREVERLWRRSGALYSDPEILAAMNEPAPARSRRWRMPLAAAATVLIAVAVGWLQPWTLWPADSKQVATITEQRNLMLADGSTVLLDADSELRVRYSGRERNVVLEKGQAQFSVQHDPRRPFVVEAGNGAVTALGTRFQVSVDGSAVTVTLLEGSISVDMPDIPSVPRPERLSGVGEQLRFDTRRESWAKQPVDVAAAQEWIKGDLVFEEWRLAAFVSEMNRFSDTKVRIADESIEDFLISGRFHTGDQQSVVQMLESGWPVDAQTVSDNEVVLSRR